MDAEQWKDIDGFPMYQVSNFGFIRNKKTGRILKTHMRGGGYATVSLMTREEGEATPCKLSVHRVVAKAFITNPDPHTKTWVNHKDFNRTNNRADNLEFVNPKENARYRSMMSNNTSGVTGVYLNKPTGKWMAYIRNEGKMSFLGLYTTKEEAEFVRLGAAAELFGDHAVDTSIRYGGKATIDWS